jgi:hypothetical protein
MYGLSGTGFERVMSNKQKMLIFLWGPIALFSGLFLLNFHDFFRTQWSFDHPLASVLLTYFAVLAFVTSWVVIIYPTKRKKNMSRIASANDTDTQRFN